MTRTTGIFQLPNGTWGFRYVYWINGKQKDIKRTKDEDGKPIRNSLKKKIMAVIDAMDLTKAQKDALYYANGWAKSEIYEAPWH